MLNDWILTVWPLARKSGHVGVRRCRRESDLKSVHLDGNPETEVPYL